MSNEADAVAAARQAIGVLVDVAETCLDEHNYDGNHRDYLRAAIDEAMSVDPAAVRASSTLARLRARMTDDPVITEALAPLEPPEADAVAAALLDEVASRIHVNTVSEYEPWHVLDEEGREYWRGIARTVLEPVAAAQAEAPRVAEPEADWMAREFADARTQQAELPSWLRTACKTCNDKGEVQQMTIHRSNGVVERPMTPCPDCAKPEADAVAAAREAVLATLTFPTDPDMLKALDALIAAASARTAGVGDEQLSEVEEHAYAHAEEWQRLYREAHVGEERLRAALALDTPYPLHSVLAYLADATEVLLDDYNYDPDGHEKLTLSIDAARAAIRALAPEQGEAEPT